MWLHAAAEDRIPRDWARRIADGIVQGATRGAPAPAEITVFGRLPQLAKLLAFPQPNSPLGELTRSTPAKRALDRAALYAASGRWITREQLAYLLQQEGVPLSHVLRIYDDAALARASAPAALNQAARDVHRGAVIAALHGQRLARPILERLFREAACEPHAARDLVDLLYSRPWGTTTPPFGESDLVHRQRQSDSPPWARLSRLARLSEHPSGFSSLPWTIAFDTDALLKVLRSGAIYAGGANAEPRPGAPTDRVPALFLTSLGLPELHIALLPTVVSELHHMQAPLPTAEMAGRPIARSWSHQEREEARLDALHEAWSGQRRRPWDDRQAYESFWQSDHLLWKHRVGVNKNSNGHKDRRVIWEWTNTDRLVADHPQLGLSFDMGLIKRLWVAATGRRLDRDGGRKQWLDGFAFGKPGREIYPWGIPGKEQSLLIRQIQRARSHRDGVVDLPIPSLREQLAADIQPPEEHWMRMNPADLEPAKIELFHPAVQPNDSAGSVPLKRRVQKRSVRRPPSTDR
jgi:hypothetical protein